MNSLRWPLPTTHRFTCSLPAAGIGATAAADTFSVSCAEGDYLLALGGRHPVVTRADGSVASQPIPVACPAEEDPPPTDGPSTQRQFKPSTNTVNGISPDLAPHIDGPADQAQFKPSPNTVNGMSPNFGAAASGND